MTSTKTDDVNLSDLPNNNENPPAVNGSRRRRQDSTTSSIYGSIMAVDMPQKDPPQSRVLYKIEDVPPIQLTIVLGIQVSYLSLFDFLNIIICQVLCRTSE